MVVAFSPPPTIRPYALHSKRGLFHSFSFLSRIRSLLPKLFTRLFNQAMKKIPGMQGSIGNIRLNLLKGALEIEQVILYRQTAEHEGFFATLEKVILDLSWTRLFSGQVVGTVTINNPKVRIEINALDNMEKRKKKRRAEDLDEPWQAKFEKFPFFSIPRFSIQGGIFSIRIRTLAGDIPLEVHDFQSIVRNISSPKGMGAEGIADFDVLAKVNDGALSLQGEAFPFAVKPTFNLDMKLEHMDLKVFNPFFRQSASVDVRAGFLSLFAEIAAAKGRCNGYAKPIVDGLNLHPLWGGMSGYLKAWGLKVIAWIFRNRRTDRIATRFNFEGNFESFGVDTFTALKGFFENALKLSFRRQLTHDIGFSRVGKTSEDVEIDYGQPSQTRWAKTRRLIKETVEGWMKHDASRMGAALSYYTAFSIAPLLVLIIAIAGFALGREAAQGEIYRQLDNLIGAQSAAAVQSMVKAAAGNKGTGGFAAIISIVALLLGASRVLNELKDALNKIWDGKAPLGLSGFVTAKLRAFGLILGIGFLLLVSLVTSAAMAGLGKFVGGLMPAPEAVLQVINFVISFGVITLLFAMMYKWLPDAPISWRDVRMGAAVTALLFTLGKFGLGIYLGKGAVGSSYGAAGAVLIMLLWVYYSSQIFFFGAEFTAVYARHYGSRSFRHTAKAASGSMGSAVNS